MTGVAKGAGTAIAEVAFVSIACWAAFVSMWERWTAPWGEAWGAWVFGAAIAAWIYLLCESARENRLVAAPAKNWLLLTAALLLAYAASFAHVPRLVTCEFAVVALGSVMLAVLPADTRASSWGLLPLLIVSPHVGTAVDFYLGFPLRLCASKLAAIMLLGNATSVGTGLSSGGSVVFVDAPCSGIRMLAAAFVLAGALSLLLQLRPASTLALLGVSVLVALFGNAHRAASLFLVNVPSEDAAHTAIGIIVFVECAVLLVITAKFLQCRQMRSAQPVRECAGAGRIAKAVFLLACVAAAIGGFPRNSHTAVAANEATAAWPKSWQGQPLVPMSLPEGINEFLSGFPGEWAQFRVGDTGKVVLLRQCTEATRKMHPAENCYAALGGTCAPMASLRDEQGHVWSRFRYTGPDGTQRVVSQCYFAIQETAGASNETQQREDLSDWLRDAPSWPDVSAWYWAAALPGSDTETTLALTVAE